jgi:hypothetical protein
MPYSIPHNGSRRNGPMNVLCAQELSNAGILYGLHGLTWILPHKNQVASITTMSKPWGRNLNLKIEWTMEVPPGSQVEMLRTGKIDAICSADGPMIPSTIKYISYSTPML